MLIVPGVLAYGSRAVGGVGVNELSDYRRIELTYTDKSRSRRTL